MPMNETRVAKQIKEDLDKDIYLYFPWLKKKLTYIMGKLKVRQKLTIGEKIVLEDNDYIPKYIPRKHRKKKR